MAEESQTEMTHGGNRKRNLSDDELREQWNGLSERVRECLRDGRSSFPDAEEPRQEFEDYLTDLSSVVEEANRRSRVKYDERCGSDGVDDGDGGPL